MLVWYVLNIFACVIDFLTVAGLIEGEKDLHILLLRQQVRMLECKVIHPKRISPFERGILAVLVTKLKPLNAEVRSRLSAILLFSPDTVLKWHRELVKHKWTFLERHKRGRPPINAALQSLIVRLAHENPDLGYSRIAGELLKLDFVVDRSSIRNVLKREQVPPRTKRQRSTQRTFLNHYKHQMLACDFLTIETLGLRTLYILFFIELHTRRVYFAGCTQHPSSVWTAQQARQLCWTLPEQQTAFRYLIHDRDTKFSAALIPSSKMKALRAFVLLFVHPMPMRLLSDGYARYDRNA